VSYPFLVGRTAVRYRFRVYDDDDDDEKDDDDDGGGGGLKNSGLGVLVG